MEKKFTDAFLEEDAVSDSGYRLKTGKTGESVKGAYKKNRGWRGWERIKRWKMPLSMRFWNDVMRRRAGGGQMNKIAVGMVITAGAAVMAVVAAAAVLRRKGSTTLHKLL